MLDELDLERCVSAWGAKRDREGGSERESLGMLDELDL